MSQIILNSVILESPMTGGVLKKLEKSEKVRSKRYMEDEYPKLVSRMTIAVTIGQSSLKTMNLKLNTVNQG